MSNEEPKPKDKFDKANISISIISTVFLMVITASNVIIAYQSSQLEQKSRAIQSQLESVKNNTQTAEIIDKLSTNLKESDVKKDIALIALNRQIADNDDKSKTMVTEIATQVYRTELKNLITKSSSQEQNTSEVMKWTPEYKDTFVALAIIGERNPNLANTLIQELNDQKKNLFENITKTIDGLDESSKTNENIKAEYIKTKLADTEKTKFIKQIIEPMRDIDPTKHDELIKTTNQINAIDEITGAFEFSIAIYYNDKNQKDNVGKFNEYLKKHNYSTKGTHFVEEGFTQKNNKSVSSIKYFHSGDQRQAEDLKTILLDYLNLPENKEWINKNPSILSADLLEFVQEEKNPNGKIELWFHFPQK
jgi:hypothetical protein